MNSFIPGKQCLLLVLFLIITSFDSFSQTPVKLLKADYLSSDEYAAIKKIVGKNKVIPAQYEKQILLALTYFPELADTRIIFRIKHAYPGLSSRPSWLSVLRKNETRIYIITISNHTIPALMPILINNQEFNAQVGVIGHELSHVADFSSKKSPGLLRIGMGNLSQRFLDRFEYRTDSICIAHGLGYQLLSWSIFVRETLHQPNWDGAGNIKLAAMTWERYMNPSTIRKRMSLSPLYQ